MSLAGTNTTGMTLEEQDRAVAQAIERDGPRLRSFIRRRVVDAAEAEDLLQDVFYELIQAYRLMKPVEQVTGWLFRVARNRIIDRFRRPRAVSLAEPAGAAGSASTLEDLLPSPTAGPEAEFARGLLLDALADAIQALPPAQREVFVAHELEGRTFADLARETGVNVNTLLARKHQAVKRLRSRLKDVHELFER